MMFNIKVFLFIAICIIYYGCSSLGKDELNLMPAPDVYYDGMLDPLPLEDPMEDIPYGGVLYATDRKPATSDDYENYYLNERGNLLRLGVAKISLHEKDISWEDVRKESLLKNRSSDFPIRVTDIEEYGILESTIPGFAERKDYDAEELDAEYEFTSAINTKLAKSNRKHIYIYIHGYKVVFENPMLVATELWHFLGYDGVMIGYAWPSTPSKWAYLRDTDTSNGYARHFRKFIEYLGEYTDADKIHIIAFSNGTRMVARAFEQLALIHQDEDRNDIIKKLKLGNLIFVGSDIDRDVFGAYLADGALNVPSHMSIYVSDKDKALGFARWLTRRERLGQMFDKEKLHPTAHRVLTEHQDHISLIDVSDAEGADTGNGHGYFRQSPWVSSDILMTLLYGIKPKQRGLALKNNKPVWEFPNDYIDRLWDAIANIDPQFRKSFYQHLEKIKK